MKLLSNAILQRNPDYVSLVQITDLHLFSDTNKSIHGVNTQSSFDAVLSVATQVFDSPDLMLFTGDLYHEPSTDNYDRLFDTLTQTNIPYVAMAGNHDVTLELDEHLPFHRRRHLPVEVDARLIGCACLELAHWDVLLLDTSCAGQVYGKLSACALDWLAKNLAASVRPCVIFCHHPMVSVNSQWIDAHMLANADDFWQVVAPHQQRLKGIFVGHIHQEMQVIKHEVPVFGCPSTGVQFKPFCKDYTIDCCPPGLRWINLYNNGLLATGIKKIDTM